LVSGGALMALSATQVVRDALQEWAQGLMSDLIPEVSVEGGPVVAGDSPDMPTLGIEWGTTQVIHARPYDVAAENNLATGQGVWLLQYEEVELAFVWRANTPELSDLFAHEFGTRAALEAVASNEDGNRVLHFEVEIGDATRTGKLYLGGEVVPVNPADNASRSLYTFRVPGTVTYPVFRVEPEAEATGLLNIIVIINGTSYELAAIPDPEA
jgi:hypothetical protein